MMGRFTKKGIGLIHVDDGKVDLGWGFLKLDGTTFNACWGIGNNTAPNGVDTNHATTLGTCTHNHHVVRNTSMEWIVGIFKHVYLQ